MFPELGKLRRSGETLQELAVLTRESDTDWALQVATVGDLNAPRECEGPGQGVAARV